MRHLEFLWRFNEKPTNQHNYILCIIVLLFYCWRVTHASRPRFSQTTSTNMDSCHALYHNALLCGKIQKFLGGVSLIHQKGIHVKVSPGKLTKEDSSFLCCPSLITGWSMPSSSSATPNRIQLPLSMRKQLMLLLIRREIRLYPKSPLLTPYSLLPI